ncbi:MAG: hypothetical protein ACO26X_03515 [Candidatus Fonsibacter ubiquis]
MYVKNYKRLLSTKNITKGDLILLCEFLEKELNQEFEPEAIADGGIVYKNPPYKAMRIYFGYGNYPWVPENVKEVWKNSEDIILPTGRVVITVLKSKDTKWSKKELEIWRTCLKKIGLKVV